MATTSWSQDASVKNTTWNTMDMETQNWAIDAATTTKKGQQPPIENKEDYCASPMKTNRDHCTKPLSKRTGTNGMQMSGPSSHCLVHLERRKFE